MTRIANHAAMTAITAASPKEEHDVVRNCEKPFDQRQPAVQLAGIWIRKIEVDCLVFIGPSSLPIGGEDW